jgi:hypothetical protein
MDIKKQDYRDPAYLLNRSKRNATGGFLSGVDLSKGMPAASGNTSSAANSGGFWGNFSSITDSIGSLFSNIAGGTSSIIGANRTTTTNINDSTKTDKGVYIFIGIGFLVLIMVLVFAFAFNKR